MNISINKKELTKSLFGIVLLSVGITIYYQSLYGMLLIGDSLFLSGLFFLCIALFRIVRHLGLLKQNRIFLSILRIIRIKKE